MSRANITPMMQQYLSIKKGYADCILFYRMGDFYEMFFDDAEVASRALEITLTSRNKKDDNPIPMCGVPFKAVKGYIARLIEQGFKVAICDQVEDPNTAKGLVHREVVRVITPGMIVEDDLLDEKTNNFILSVGFNHEALGLAYLDISTATFRLTESADNDVIAEEILRIAPREMLLPETAKDGRFYNSVRQWLDSCSVSFLPPQAFDLRQSRERLLSQFKTLNLEGFGCEEMAAAVSAAGGVLYYVGETQKQPIEHVAGLETYSLENYLWIDDLSCRNLELVRNLRTSKRQGTLLGVLDRTRTAMGGRLFKQWLRYPLNDLEGIGARHDAVQETQDSLAVRRDIMDCLDAVSDLERLGSKITMGHCNARDMVALKRSLQGLPPIWKLLSRLSASLFRCDVDTGPLDTLAELLESAVREDAPPTVQEGNMIRTGFDAELDELIRISTDGKSWLAELEAREKQQTAINSLKVRFNKVFGYYIEVPKTHSEAIPPHYVRKQTLVNAERYITDELKEFEFKVLNAEEQRAKLEHRIFERLRSQIVARNGIIQQAARFLARIDCLLNLAELADQNDYTRPEIHQQGHIRITEGRHPVIEKMITGQRFVPNTVELDDAENQVLIITGPNMAGKSTVLRQVALTVIMAQMGSFVAARKASISMTDRIFTRVGALDNLSHGQSTFMVEMEETANILNHASPRSLVIMDEIGRGTSTFDGLSIAWAVAEYLHDLRDRGVKTLFATHYHELTDLALFKDRVKNFNIAVKEWNDEIIFLRKLVEGGTNRSYGIQVARLAGIPEKVIRRAKRILYKIENGEHPFGAEASPNASQTADNKGVQLELFRKNGDVILDRLKRLDIARITPLEALNFLDELKQKAVADR